MVVQGGQFSAEHVNELQLEGVGGGTMAGKGSHLRNKLFYGLDVVLWSLYSFPFKNI